MLTGVINHLDMLVGELCPPTSKHLEGDHIYAKSALKMHIYPVLSETAEITCQQAERLTFDGTQYVMTSYHPKDIDTIEVDMKKDNEKERMYVFGCRSMGVSVDNNFYLACVYNVTYPSFASDENMILNAVSHSEMHTVSLGQHGYYLDGELQKEFTNAVFDSAQTLCIGALNDSGTLDSRMFSGEIYSVRIYRGNNLLHEYIPASERGTEGLYDLQTGRFYPRMSAVGTVVEISGRPPIVLNSAGESMKELIIYGNSRGVGDYDSETGKYAIPVTVRGKNIFDKDNADIVELYPNTDGTATASGTTSATRQRSFCMRVSPNTDYTVSVLYSGGVTARVAGYSSYPAAGAQCEFVDRELVSLTPMVNSFTTTGNTNYILCYFSYGRDDASIPEVLEHIQLEYGLTATDYDPYIVSRTVLYTDSPLMEGEFTSESGDIETIVLSQGRNSISVGTQIQPDSITIKYLI